MGEVLSSEELLQLMQPCCILPDRVQGSFAWHGPATDACTVLTPRAIESVGLYHHMFIHIYIYIQTEIYIYIYMYTIYIYVNMYE